MSNPFRAARQRLGLTQSGMARTAGLSLPTIASAEAGATANPRTLLTALEHLGFDAGQLERDYQTWLTEQRQGVLTAR